MTERNQSDSPTPSVIAAHYASGYDADRLQEGTGQLDRDRSRELLRRELPPAPAFANLVIPAQAGIQIRRRVPWIPACAAMTKLSRAVLRKQLRLHSINILRKPH